MDLHARQHPRTILPQQGEDGVLVPSRLGTELRGAEHATVPAAADVGVRSTLKEQPHDVVLSEVRGCGERGAVLSSAEIGIRLLVEEECDEAGGVQVRARCCLEGTPELVPTRQVRSENEGAGRSDEDLPLSVDVRALLNHELHQADFTLGDRLL